MRISTLSVAAGFAGLALVAGCNTSDPTPTPTATTAAAPTTSVSVSPSASAVPSLSPSASPSASASPSKVPSTNASDLPAPAPDPAPSTRTSMQAVSDPGLRRCNQFSKALTEGRNPLSPDLSAVEYARIRADFRASRHVDVRDAGVKLLNVYIAGAGEAQLDTRAVLNRALVLNKACNAHK